MSKIQRKRAEVEFKNALVNNNINYVGSLVADARLDYKAKHGNVSISINEIDDFQEIYVYRSDELVAQFNVKTENGWKIRLINLVKFVPSYWNTALVNSVYNALTGSWLNLEWDKNSKTTYLDYYRSNYKHNYEIVKPCLTVAGVL